MQIEASLLKCRKVWFVILNSPTTCRWQQTFGLPTTKATWEWLHTFSSRIWNRNPLLVMPLLVPGSRAHTLMTELFKNWTAYLSGTKLRLIKRLEGFWPITPLTLVRHSGNIRWFSMKMFKSVMKKIKMKQARMAHSLFKTLERYSILMMTPSISNFLHTRCVSHTLKLPASTDADKAYWDIVHKKQYHAAFSKCFTLWDTVNKSSKAVDAVKEVYDKQLIRKMVTRSNSKYESVKC